MIYIIVDFYKRCKYFFYINLFINVLILNFFTYKITHKINYTLIGWLHYTINLNGSILIKIVQWLNTNLELLDIENTEILYDTFSSFYENCNIHNLNYTKKLFLNEFNIDFDNIIELDNSFQIKSGSIAQVYKAKFVKNPGNELPSNQVVAFKVVHPDIYYQFIFPIMFIKFYKYLVKNIYCLNCYDTVFTFDDFFNNLSNQSNMQLELNNMKYFYDCYKENDHILIPKPLHATKNILIMEFIDGEKFDSTTMSVFEKQKIVLLLTLFIKDNYYFKDYYHSDLHESNWKVIKFEDFYKIIIYDYGYISTNKFKEHFKKLTYYNDILDVNSIIGLAYDNCKDIKMNKKKFIFKFEEYMIERKIIFNEPFCDDIICALYNFIFINNINIESYMFELFISMILFKKNIMKFLSLKKIGVSNYNTIISSYIGSIHICDKYNIFTELKNYYQVKYIDNPEIKKFYDFENCYFENLKTDNSLDI